MKVVLFCGGLGLPMRGYSEAVGRRSCSGLMDGWRSGRRFPYSQAIVHGPWVQRAFPGSYASLEIGRVIAEQIPLCEAMDPPHGN
jgi:hypothetical protein